MPDHKQLRVFVVDDEQVIALTLAMILEHHGSAVTAFFDPLQALRAAALNAPDLLISDVMMPRLSGVDLAIQLQILCPRCKVLLFSEQAETADLLLNAREQGHHFRLLSKPLHPSDLLRQMRAQDASDNVDELASVAD